MTRINLRPVHRRGAALVAPVLALIVAATVLPAGAPLGVIVLGLTQGALVSLTAMGLILVFRATGAVNFAQAEIGGLAAAAGVLVVTGWQAPYVVGVGVGIAVAAISGLVVERTVVARLRGRSALLLTVATIGLAQLFGGLQVGAPSLFDDDLAPFSRFSFPWSVSVDIGPIVLGADHLVAALGVAAVAYGLSRYLGGSDLGIAARGIADNAERAVLLGVPVGRVSAVTWIVAATLSGISAVLSTPLQGISLGSIGGPASLLPALAAAVLGRMTSLPRAMLAALGLGVFRELVFWSYPRSAAVDVFLFLVVAVALLLQRKEVSRDVASTADLVATAVPLPREARRLPPARATQLVLAGLGGAAFWWIANVAGASDRGLVTNMAIFAMVAVSLVVLSGWSGQVSLGQFAFAGVGAGVTAGLLSTAGWDVFASLLAAGVVGAVAACVVGIPALRMQGLLLAVVTLAFAVPVSSFVLSSRYAPAITPSRLPRPELFGVVDLTESWYFFGLTVLFLGGTLALVRNLDRSRVGRAIRAVRDNERSAASYGIDAARMRLLAYAIAGAIAGVAGGLYAISLRGVGFGAFNANQSVAAFTMVVVGGLGSIPGALLGAAYIQGTQYWLTGAAQFLASGFGVLVLVLVLPEGIGPTLSSLYRGMLVRYARSRDIALPGLVSRAGGTAEHQDEPTTAGDRPSPGSSVAPGGVLQVSGLDAWYGSVQIIDGVDLSVDEGTVYALLGTNGAGKSTVLRALAGVGPRAAGTVRYRGVDLSEASPAERVAHGMTLVSGGHAVFRNLTVEENLRLAGWIHGDRDARRQAIENAVALFPVLSEHRGAVAGLLSGGEQHMVGLAMALVTEPTLLLIDELSLGLAPTVVKQLMGIVEELRHRGMTIVLVEQSLHTATEIADSSTFLERGRVRFVGRPGELLERPDLARSVFFDAGTPSVPTSTRVQPTHGRVLFEVSDVSVDILGRAVLDQVSFHLSDGEILGLIGANGAGKTTLLDVCSGFRPPRSGVISMLGHDVTGDAAASRARRGLGRVFQNARLFPSMTVRDAVAVSVDRWMDVREPVALALRLRPARRTEAAVRRRVEELLQLGGLVEYADVPVAHLSTGTRRLVELVAVVGFRPRVLLLDEPTAGVAQREAEAVALTIEQFRTELGIAMVIVEHDIPMISSVADRLVCLDQGAVLSEGAPHDVLHDPRVLEAYVGGPAPARQAET